jgi:arsenite-transporting ATPase
VGKTTCAAATAVRLAVDSPERHFLLVSTDPAHSLSDSLAGSPPPCNLAVLEIDAQEYLTAFRQDHHTKFREIASRGTFLDDEDISSFLDLSFPGRDELMAFLEISKWVAGEAYSCIVVDTAPTGHTLRLLSMSELIGQWLDALDALLAKNRYMKQLYSGSYCPDELDEFLLDLSGSVQRMEALLKDTARCRFVPVMLPEVLSIRETTMLLDELKRLEVPVTDILVNKLFPDNACPVCAEEHARQMKELGRLSAKFSGYRLWGFPLHPEEVRGLDSLKGFWMKASPLTIPTSGAKQLRRLTTSSFPQVDGPAQPPSQGTRLLLFAGKGGVGKTTLACATALHLARTLPGKEVLLFSTDPANSLSACLEKRIGPKPKRIAQGLSVMEIDPQAEFETLKELYAEELESFLSTFSPNLDLTFDREVMERILDLSPPGLDEIMALTLVMEFLAQGKYDLFILDSAPTGHLIRLLELPEIIDQWLKVFFNLFLKYKKIFRLPNITRRLVQMSMVLKRLRSMLKDPSQSSLYAVAILTEMAFEETTDLVAACVRMEVCVPTLFLNLATAANQCPFCPALHQKEAHIKDKFQQAFPQKHHATIYRQGEMRGLTRLGELGQALYRTSQKETIPAVL